MAKTVRHSTAMRARGLMRRMMRSVIAAAGTQSANGVTEMYPHQLLSIRLVEFTQQLLFQMSPRSLFDRPTLDNYALLLCLAFPRCSRFHRLRDVPDLWAARADFSLFWFCIRIHDCFALRVSPKNSRNCNVVRDNFAHRRLS